MRIRIKDVEPKVYGIMSRFEKYLEESDLSTTHKELIKIRASQLNNCGYCLNNHSQEALKSGESEARIYMLPLWKTVPHFYSEEELVILQMTEEITLIYNGLSDETYNKAMALFSENYVAQIMTAIIVINVWNRIGVATHMEDDCTL
ncbi:carboxymuconolactone decarboxylase family protein [Dysgonomonas sp. HDW5A]|nr:carboxymuconolactone decarboxylase family protein [Dysgonomonas sp. HDW5A]